MRRLLPLVLLLVGCGSSGSPGSSADDRPGDPLARYAGRECVVRVRPNVLGTVRENPVDVDGGMQRSIGVAATGTFKGVDGGWVTVARKDGGTTLIAQDTIVTVDFEPASNH